MTKKRKIGKWTFIIILWLIVLFNILGLIVETLFTFNVLQTEVAPIKNLGVISTTLTLAFIIVANIVWWNILKEKKEAFKWWNILAGIALITIFYKFLEPTALTIFIPGYFIVMPVIVVIIWAAGFSYLKKFRPRAVTSQLSH